MRCTTRWLSAALAAGAGLAGARRLVAYRIEDHSMEPTLWPGDWVLGVRRQHVHPNEVIVFEHPGQPGFEVVKRVAAGPGQQVEGATLGEAEFWGLGDNLAAGSVDSRTLGRIPLGRVRARLLWRYRPWPPTRVR